MLLRSVVSKSCVYVVLSAILGLPSAQAGLLKDISGVVLQSVSVLDENTTSSSKRYGTDFNAACYGSPNYLRLDLARQRIELSPFEGLVKPPRSNFDETYRYFDIYDIKESIQELVVKGQWMLMDGSPVDNSIGTVRIARQPDQVLKITSSSPMLVYTLFLPMQEVQTLPITDCGDFDG